MQDEMSDFDYDSAARALLEALAIKRGITFDLPIGPQLIFVGGAAIRGVAPGNLLVCQPGKASVVLDDPNHFNKFIFVKAGFSMQVGEVATLLIRAMLKLGAEPEGQLLIERKSE